MDIQEYISSGVLELYVLGALSDEESRAVEQMAESHPEVRAEIEAIELSVEQMSMAGARQPRAGLKEEIFRQIEADDAPPVAAPASKTPIIPIGDTRPEANGVSASSAATSPGLRRWLVAASIAFLLAGAAAAYFALRLSSAEKEIAILRDENAQVAQENGELRRSLQSATTELVMRRDPQMISVMLKTPPGKQGAATAVLRWHAASKDIYIDVPDAHLPEIPHDHQYQLWAIVDGKPVDAGVFDLESGGEALHKLKRIERAQAFAVTVEPRGGSPAPTLEKMLVHGEVVGA